MGLQQAEQVFGKTASYAQSDERQLREALRALLVDHRVMLDTGMERHAMRDPKSTAKVAEEHRARVAARMGGGAAVGMASAGELLFPEPLPPCERWGDIYTQTYAFPSRRMAASDVLGHESRLSLPCAVLVAASTERVGPGGTMRAELEAPTTAIVSYAQIVARAEAVRRGAATLDEAMAAAVGLSIQDTRGDEAPPDPIAIAQDGDRVWPPSALLNSEGAARVAQMVGSVCDDLDNANSRAKKADGVGVYMSVFKRATREDVDNAAVRDLLGLGVGIFARNPLALHSARRHAMHAAMAAHMSGHAQLGDALVRLGSLLETLAPPRR